MSANSELARARAESNFKKAEARQSADDQVRADIAAEVQAVDVKTAKLKELRLAKETADRDAEAAKPAGPKSKRKPATP